MHQEVKREWYIDQLYASGALWLHNSENQIVGASLSMEWDELNFTMYDPEV